MARRAKVHAALGDVNRLRIVDLLAVSDASPSELSVALEIPSNLLAHHVAALEHCGLVSRRRSEGDGRRTYLSLNRYESWLVPDAGSGTTIPEVHRIVFVCTANTARSHLAAALWRRASPIEATSAGTHPGNRVNPRAVAAARRHDLQLPDVAPRLLSDTLDEGDVVITVCDRAHEELGRMGFAHWSVPDPVQVGTAKAFDVAHDDLARRVEGLAPLLPPSAACGVPPSF